MGWVEQLRSTRGKVARLGIAATCNQSLVGIEPEIDRLDDAFLFHQLDGMYKAIRALSGGDGRTGLNVQLVSSIQIALLPISDQRAFGQALDVIEQEIGCASTIAGKLRRQRDALASELLTGRLRVPEAERLSAAAG
ncbi:MAG: restriction endonuclease subunit S [Stellaceae bacterium]